MFISEIFKISFSSIAANKVRSVLTTLGIIIGIGAVITMLAVGQGAQSSILEQVAGLGANTISIIPVGNFQGPQSRSSIQSLLTSRLDREIVELLDNPVIFKEIIAIAPEINKSYEISYRSQSKTYTVYGVTNDYFVAREIELHKGRALNENDDNKLSKVVVLGYRSYANLFGESEAIGKSVKISGSNYLVIGVAEESGGELDNNVYVPLSTAANVLIGDSDYSQITVKVNNENNVDPVAIRIENELMDYYRVVDEDKANFTIFTSKDIVSLTQTITGVFTTLLASIASISLIVGGIGIMNIMLVSVSERTKEIGLRKAVGAKQNAILSQFLIEAIILTVIGGVIGISLGAGLALLIGAVGGIPVKVTIESIVLATSVSATIGLVFGFYPAYRAAKLNPIEALRYE